MTSLGVRSAAEEAGEGQPAERQRDQEIGEVLAVDAVGAVGLGRPVERLAVGQHVRFRELVEAVDQELDDEDEQEDRGDLEEAREVHAMAVARPQVRDERGDQRAADGAADDVHRLDLEQERVHQHGGLHALARDHQQREAEDAPERAAAGLARTKRRACPRCPFSCAVRPATCAPSARRPGSAATMARMPSHSAWFRALASSRPAPMLSSIETPDPPMNRGDELPPPRFPEVGEADGNDQKGLEAFPQRNDECLQT